MFKNILGAHVSIAGGVSFAFREAEMLGCEAMQIFTKSSNQWQAKELTVDDIDKFKQEAKRTKIKVVAHDSYLINLASPKDFIYEKSLAAFKEELVRCDQLEIPYLVMHPGSHVGSGEEAGVKKIAASFNRLFAENNFKVKIALETTAGQGTNLGNSFEQLAQIVGLVKNHHQLVYCLDTCHIFTAGYDLRTQEVYEKTMKDFDNVLGLQNLAVIHLNDSKKDLGSRIDRHENIGRGFLGQTAFKLLLNDKRLATVPKILETPLGDGDQDERLQDLKLLRKLE